MCSQYNIKVNLHLVGDSFGAALSSGAAEDFKIPQRITPKAQAPVLVSRNGRPVITLMQFSLVPSWAKEMNLKFATHNARLDAVEEKAAWKTPFIRHHCIIPLNEFIEAIYFGEFAGNMVVFEREDSLPLYAAGIFDCWIDEAAGRKLFSFAMITGESCEFIRNTGHDRQPLFLPESSCIQWLQMQGLPAGELKEFLHADCFTPGLCVRVDRAMKPGWEKRRGPSLNSIR